MWVLNTIYILLFIGGVFICRKLKKRSEDSYEFDADTPEGRKERFFDRTSNSNALVKAVIIIFLVGTGLILGMMNLLIDDYWLAFGNSRKQVISDRFGITFDSDVVPKKYFKGFGGQAGANIRIELVIRKSPEEFIEENMHANILTYIVNNELHYAPYFWEKYPPKTEDEREMAESDYAEPYPLSGFEIAEYNVTNGSRKFILRVYDNGNDSYLVKIHY